MTASRLGEVAAAAPSAVSEREVLAARHIGPYRISETLGAGGMGAVYLGFDEALERYAAVKVLSRVNPRSVARFLGEARRQARLDHPNIVSVYGAGTESHDGEPVHYIALKYIEGSTLRQFVEDSGPLDPAHATQLILDAARGLYYVHCEGFIHRDIKPGNILVDLGDRALISDFGIARDGTGEGETGGEFVGTWNYASPEQVARARVDVRTDIYSLGLTWLYALTGRDPIDDARSDDHELCIDPAFPKPLRDTLRRMLEANPEHRFGSMLNCVEAIEQTLHALQGTSAGDAASEDEWRPSRAIAPAFCWIVAVALAAAFAAPGASLLRVEPPASAAAAVPALEIPAPPVTPTPSRPQPVSPLLAEIDKAAHELDWLLDRIEPMLDQTAEVGTLFSDRFDPLGVAPVALDPGADLTGDLRRLSPLLTDRLGELDRFAQDNVNVAAQRKLDDLATITAPRVAAIFARLEEGPIEVGRSRVLFDRYPTNNLQYFAFLLHLSATGEVVLWERFSPGGSGRRQWVDFQARRTFRRPRFDRALEPVVGLHRSGIEAYCEHVGKRLPERDEWLTIAVPRLRELFGPDSRSSVFEHVLWEGEPFFASLAGNQPRFRQRDTVRSSEEAFRLLRELR